MGSRLLTRRDIQLKYSRVTIPSRKFFSRSTLVLVLVDRLRKTSGIVGNAFDSTTWRSSVDSRYPITTTTL
jgi:hypothetical protein